MFLKDHDLIQMDEVYLQQLEHEQLKTVSARLLSDLKEAHDRLNENSQNSSRPPSTEAPWINLESENNTEKTEEFLEEESRAEADLSENTEASGSQEASTTSDAEDKDSEIDAKDTEKRAKKKPGKQEGSTGHGRTQKLPVTGEVTHQPSQCTACEKNFDSEDLFIATTGHFIIDIKVGAEETPGLHITNTKHIYGETTCSECHHQTSSIPEKCAPDEEWSVEMSQWHLVGPTLVSLICFMAMRMKLSRRRIQEYFLTWYGLQLSVGTINQCIHEAGRALSPVEEKMIEDVLASELVHIDETSWKEKGKLLWLWVFVGTTAVFYTVGSRGKEVLEKIIGPLFEGWIMTDGYGVYRDYMNRLRCWAHLTRKARGLEESLNQESRIFGKGVLAFLDLLMESIYAAREGPSESLLPQFKEKLEEFQTLCEKYRNAKNDKLRALAREFLNDWDAIFRILEHPHFPITNNLAEQILRHWVLLRRANHGTKSPQGTRTVGILASVIDTLRMRNLSPWEYIAQTVEQRRKGLPVPPLPQANLLHG